MPHSVFMGRKWMPTFIPGPISPAAAAATLSDSHSKTAGWHSRGWGDIPRLAW
jgi:hypothetical protein